MMQSDHAAARAARRLPGRLKHRSRPMASTWMAPAPPRLTFKLPAAVPVLAPVAVLAAVVLGLAEAAAGQLQPGPEVDDAAAAGSPAQRAHTLVGQMNLTEKLSLLSGPSPAARVSPLAHVWDLELVLRVYAVRTAHAW